MVGLKNRCETNVHFEINWLEFLNFSFMEMNVQHILAAYARFPSCQLEKNWHPFQSGLDTTGTAQNQR